ncbi:bis-aminopropyl spermidine synthase family protein [Salinactinospora qingdaonensis]|uniref:Bis-aminopropyl spermidine synthase family protein n=1 Tax=Salinactinospora qingdaonensis TaxID=702744 RepID=A0ABP7EY02_9ACTN
MSTAQENLPQQPAAVLAEISEAIGLQEGAAGVRAVVWAFHQVGAASTREVSRRTGLPVPIAAAIGNELRRRGLLGRERPSRLTEAGTALLGERGAPPKVEVACAACAGTEITIPAKLREAVSRLADIAAEGPGADLALDQSHCTPETKVRRVLALLRAGVLPGNSLLLVGDDDLISLAVGVVGEVLGVRLTERLAVADISPEILEFISERATSLGVPVEVAEHDLREPLPVRLRHSFDAAMTDPPYTAEGAKLFLSRVIEGLRPGPAHNVFLSFGAKAPTEMLDVQRAITDLGLVTHGLIRNFNEYEGSGILGGTGFLQHLLTTDATAPLFFEGYQGPLYTRDKRGRQRQYICVSCEALIPVGAGARWNAVAELQQAGCPNCGKGPFRPGRLVEPAASGSEDAGADRDARQHD